MMISKFIKTGNLFHPKRLIQTILRFNSDKSILSYYANTGSDLPLVGQTLQERLNSISALKPNEVAYKFCATQTSFTFLEVNQRVNELAQSYLSLGLQKGDRVALMLPNVPELVLSIYALAQIGCVSVLMNPAYNIDEIDYMMKKTNVKCAVIFDNFKTLKHYDILSRICPELKTSSKGELKSTNMPNLKHVVLVRNGLVGDESEKYLGTWSFKDDLAKFNGVAKPLPVTDIDDTVTLLFTSGTTGFPKAAPLSHLAMVNSARSEAHFPGCFESNRNVCIPIPIFHLFGLVVGTISPIVNGTRIVYPHFFPDTVATMRAIESERCTGLKGAPVIFFDLLHHPDRAKYDLSSLETILLGASVVPKDLILKIKKELNLKSAIIGYAMTESGCAGSVTRVSDVQKSEHHAYETIGSAMPFVETKIVDLNTGATVERGVDGEICIRSYGNMKGYWEDPVKTAETIDENRWLHTGDIGHMTEDGYIVYKTRAKEMIIRGGANVYPAEIERLFRTHKNILDCYVFGVPDERLGEEIAIWIKLKPGCESTTEKEIIDFANQHIASFKVPKYVRFVTAFPISATGKVQKFKMTQQMVEYFKENIKQSS